MKRMLSPRGAFLALALAAATAFAGAAIARVPGLSGYDPDAPIDISAESIELREAENILVAEGRVDIRQGGLRLQADRVEAHYITGEQTGRGGSPAEEIRRMEARGNVHVSTEAESISGNWAVYDVPASTVTVGGNVVLARGADMLSGSRLVINLETGHSRLEGAATADGGKGRVRGLFLPAARTGGGGNAAADPSADD
jgi:lipopolysaccharide export system protein LptA